MSTAAAGWQAIADRLNAAHAHLPGFVVRGPARLPVGAGVDRERSGKGDTPRAASVGSSSTTPAGQAAIKSWEDIADVMNVKAGLQGKTWLPPNPTQRTDEPPNITLDTSKARR